MVQLVQHVGLYEKVNPTSFFTGAVPERGEQARLKSEKPKAFITVPTFITRVYASSQAYSSFLLLLILFYYECNYEKNIFIYSPNFIIHFFTCTNL